MQVSALNVLGRDTHRHDAKNAVGQRLTLQLVYGVSGYRVDENSNWTLPHGAPRLPQGAGIERSEPQMMH